MELVSQQRVYRCVLTSMYPAPAESQQSAAPVELVSQQRVYRSLVLQDIIDSERAHIGELQTLCKNFLQPLSRSDV